jgi:hypothetical protein
MKQSLTHVLQFGINSNSLDFYIVFTQALTSVCHLILSLTSYRENPIPHTKLIITTPFSIVSLSTEFELTSLPIMKRRASPSDDNAHPKRPRAIEPDDGTLLEALAEVAIQNDTGEIVHQNDGAQMKAETSRLCREGVHHGDDGVSLLFCLTGIGNAPLEVHILESKSSTTNDTLTATAEIGVLTGTPLPIHLHLITKKSRCPLKDEAQEATLSSGSEEVLSTLNTCMNDAKIILETLKRKLKEIRSLKRIWDLDELFSSLLHTPDIVPRTPAVGKTAVPISQYAELKGLTFCLGC